MQLQVASAIFSTIISLAAAGLIGYPGYYNGFPFRSFPALTYTPVVSAHESYDTHPQYNYGYSVEDKFTGDQKSHTESRDGDTVTGRYSLVDADGLLRIVTYTADPVNGFNAVVDRQPGPRASFLPAAPIYPAAAANQIPVYSTYTPYYANSIYTNYVK